MDLGDSRRTARLVRMAASLAETPSGKVPEVFRSRAEQTGGPRFSEQSNVRAGDLLAATRAATTRRCERESWAHVVIDGTRLRLTAMARPAALISPVVNWD